MKPLSRFYKKPYQTGKKTNIYTVTDFKTKSDSLLDWWICIHTSSTCFVNSDVVFTHSGNLIQTILSSGKENTLSEEDMERIKKVLGQ